MSELTDVWFVILHTEYAYARPITTVRSGHMGYVNTSCAPTREDAVRMFMEGLTDAEEIVSALTGRISDVQPTKLP